MTVGTAERVTLPSHHVLLMDGSVVEIRPVAPADEPTLTALYERSSAESMRRRFFSYSQLVGRQDIDRMLQVPVREHLALIAIDHNDAVGVASLAKSSDPGYAEFALLVDDTRHGQGIGTLLIEHLIAAARRLGYTHLHADVLSENVEMLDVLRELGVTRTSHTESGVVEVDFAVPERGDWPTAVQRRESIAEYASLDAVLAPASIAVVGAGKTADGVGHRLLAAVVNGGFHGKVIAVNRDGLDVCGAPGYRTLLEVPDPPQLVVVAVPADQVEQVIQQAASIGVRGAVIISDGFAELGEAGRELQRRIVGHARRGGMRLIGPNCLGIVNLAPGVSLDATFATPTCVPGHVGVASQSGGVGLALMEALARRGIGVSTFVSLGNKADVSGNDLLQYWNRDPATNVCLLYLESFGNARKFAEIAREMAPRKPIVAITAGRSVAGARGVRSHTAAATTPDVAVEALFRQAGVIRAGTLTEAMDAVCLLEAGAVPSGRRVGIVSNGGGPAALAADACSAAGLELPVFSDALRARLAAGLPGHAATGNPVDTTAGGAIPQLAAAARLIAESGEVDSVVVIHTSLARGDQAGLTTELGAAALARPTIAVLIGGDAVDGVSASTDPVRIPAFSYPEDMARALSEVAAYGEWRSRQARTDKPPKKLPWRAEELVARYLDEHPQGGWLDTDRAAELISACRIPVIETVGVRSTAEAVGVANRLGYPVVVKIAEGSVLHRSDEHGVYVGLRSAIAVRRAVRSIRSHWGRASRIVVQPMCAKGVETAVGLIQDPSVGPIVMLALGGVATDLLADRAFRLPPLSLADAREQITALRASPLLFGYRGSEPADTRALAKILRQVGEIGRQLPEVAELDLNPVIVSPHGAVAVDVKVRLAPSSPTDPFLRRLS